MEQDIALRYYEKLAHGSDLCHTSGAPFIQGAGTNLTIQVGASAMYTHSSKIVDIKGRCIMRHFPDGNTWQQLRSVTDHLIMPRGYDGG